MENGGGMTRYPQAGGEVNPGPAAPAASVSTCLSTIQYTIVYPVVLRNDCPAARQAQVPALLHDRMDSKTGTYMCT